MPQEKRKAISDAVMPRTREQDEADKARLEEAKLGALNASKKKADKDAADKKKADEEKAKQAETARSDTPEASAKRAEDQKRSDALAVLSRKKKELTAKGYPISSPEFQALVKESNDLLYKK